ncbi:hypothetical protein AGABI2DRAFT_139949, partial [Agaricus bisporus var. bisporus H97]|uniref:hypothetical protein n=1 Tax=Agaricus bisporus var. bisporus (strain H97 / ATCC MYA-4626 / FGSC 10389) TaxID=936046 RepID=UPI00029F7157
MNLARGGWAKREEFDTSLLPSRCSGEGILRVTRGFELTHGCGDVVRRSATAAWSRIFQLL